MKLFLVGGAVRDQIMGITPKDEDFVVVGSSPEEMLSKGFSQVGADFPVFLDSQGREFALARTERKVGEGHTGFETTFDSSVTLDDDLARRDFTMNAMAIDEGSMGTGPIIDPFNGRQDIADRIIRHVSEAFKEDPLRVLRAARFAARFGFTIAPETRKMMRDMVVDGELAHLHSDRVWKELSRAVMEDHPHIFFHVMRSLDALHVFGIKDEDGFFFDFQDMLVDAANDNASEAVRWMILGWSMSPTDREQFIQQVKPPREVIGWLRIGVDLMNVFTLDGIMSFAKRFNLWQNHDIIPHLRNAIKFMPAIRRDGGFLFNVLDGIIEGSAIGFTSLSQVQQNELQGPGIGAAIELMRRKVMFDKLTQPIRLRMTESSNV